MTALEIIILFGGAVALSLTVSLATRPLRRDWHAVWVSLLLVATYGAGKLIFYAMGPAANLRLYPLLDAGCAFVLFMLFVERRERWKLAILFALLTKELLHFVFWTFGAGDIKRYGGDYQLALNILYFIEIIANLWPGGMAIADRVTRGPRLRSRPGRMVSVVGRDRHPKGAP